MSDYKFNKFTGMGSKLNNYSISVGKGHTFGFLSGFYVKEQLTKYKKVYLFFDPEKKAVAFKFLTDADAKGAFTIIHSKQGNAGSVTARSFVESIQIGGDEYTGQRSPKKIYDSEHGDLYVIDLLSDEKEEA